MKKHLLPVPVFILLTTNLLSAGISSIEELDDVAVFSIGLMSDNQGHCSLDLGKNSDYKSGGKYYNHAIRNKRVEDWSKEHHPFLLGVGDHVIKSRIGITKLLDQDSYFRSHFYFAVGDHDNDMAINGSTGPQTHWGRGVHMYEYGDMHTRSNVEWRPVQSSKVNSGGNQYTDQKVDWYARMDSSKYPKLGPFTVHVIGVHYGDNSALAPRSKDFMMDKLMEIGASKTDYDLVFVLAHSKGQFLYDATGDGYMSWSEVDTMMDIADAVFDASPHRYKVHNRADHKYNREKAIWVNTGQTMSTGYVELHVLENPVRFTVQYVSTKEDERTLQTTHAHDPNDDRWDPEEVVAYIKEVGGPYYPVNWSNLNVTLPPNNAKFVSQTVPMTMNKGETQQVSITMQNTGEDTWRSSDGHRLGAQNPRDNTAWTGNNRISLPHNVAPGQQVTFTFNITAPNVDDFVNFQWQMVDDTGANTGWFGQFTEDSVIAVGTPPNLVQLYGDTYYGGWEASFGVGNFTLADLIAAGGVNNDVDSVRVAPGYKVELYDSDNFVGELEVHTADNPDTPWHNKVTSLKVMPVNGAPVPDNPVVSFLSPVGDVSMATGADLALEVDAVDADGIDRVRLYLDGVELARSEGAAPYTWGPGQNDAELMNLQAGTYILTARATDNTGATGEASISLFVSDPTPPLVRFITPAGDATLDVGDDLYVNVEAIDSDGIDRVRLYKDGVKLSRSEGMAPYEWNGPDADAELVNLQAGSFVLTARATDNSGSMAEVSIIITVQAVVTDPYEDWKIANNVTLDDVDDDGDGMSNLLEFALAGDPQSAVSGQRPVVSRNGNDFEFSFHRAESSVTYTVEKSTDLVNWIPYAVDPGSVGGDVAVTVPDAEMDKGKLFLRLRVNN